MKISLRVLSGVLFLLALYLLLGTLIIPCNPGGRIICDQGYFLGNIINAFILTVISVLTVSISFLSKDNLKITLKIIGAVIALVALYGILFVVLS